MRPDPKKVLRGYALYTILYRVSFEAEFSARRDSNEFNNFHRITTGTEFNSRPGHQTSKIGSTGVFASRFQPRMAFAAGDGNHEHETVQWGHQAWMSAISIRDWAPYTATIGECPNI